MAKKEIYSEDYYLHELINSPESIATNTIPRIYRKNTRFILKAIDINPEVYKYLSFRQRLNTKIAMKAVSKDKKNMDGITRFSPRVGLSIYGYRALWDEPNYTSLFVMMGFSPLMAPIVIAFFRALPSLISNLSAVSLLDKVIYASLGMFLGGTALVVLCGGIIGAVIALTFAYRYIKYRIMKKKNFEKLAFKALEHDHSAISEMDKTAKKNKNFILRVLSKYPDAVEHISPKLALNKEFMSKVIAINPQVAEFLRAALPDFIKDSIKSNGKNANEINMKAQEILQLCQKVGSPTSSMVQQRPATQTLTQPLTQPYAPTKRKRKEKEPIIVQ